jgi:hypothetical protein
MDALEIGRIENEKNERVCLTTTLSLSITYTTLLKVMDSYLSQGLIDLLQT